MIEPYIHAAFNWDANLDWRKCAWAILNPTSNSNPAATRRRRQKEEKELSEV